MRLFPFFKSNLSALSLILLASLHLQAQQDLKIGSSLVRMVSPSNYKVDDKSSENLFGNKRFLILQRFVPFSDKVEKKLAGKGIVLGPQLSPFCRIASVPVTFPMAQLKEFGFEGVAPYSTALRMAPNLAKSASSANRGTILYQILSMPGIVEQDVRKGWKPGWGTLQDVWPGHTSKYLVLASDRQVDTLLSAGWVQWLEEAEGELTHYNSTASASGRINYIKMGVDSLSGKGVTVGIGDGGLVESHGDLESHQENLVATRVPTFGSHQDHVTGTIAGAGLLSASKQGMAPDAQVFNLTTTSVISSAPALRSTYGMVLTNNSYGITLNCNRAGMYSASSVYVDDQLCTMPDLLHVFAAGNSGYLNCGTYPTGFRTISEGYPASKNALTVGAVTAKDQFAWFSSSGPVMDGRVKPEIVADGDNLISTVPFDGYDYKGGTSQAAPVVTGTLALLIQRYRQLYAANPASALLKGLICNSADDLGLPHVDFTYGYGRINARKAVRVLEKNGFTSGTIASFETRALNLVPPPNARSLKVMLVWTDPAGAVSSPKALVHDLDLKVIKSGQVFLPWVMNHTPSGVGSAATRQTDTLNNIEQVTVDILGAEPVEIQVCSKLLSSSTQSYYLVYEWVEPELTLTYPSHNQVIKSGSVLPVRWDINQYDFEALALEVRADSGQTWSQATAIANPKSLYVEYMLPNADFQTYWFRLKGIADGETIVSNEVQVLTTAQPIVQVEACDQTLRLSWNTSPRADQYEIRVLNREEGRWESMGFASVSPFLLSLPGNGKSVFVSVKPWKGNASGLASEAVKGTPVSRSCSWANDLGLVSLESPVSGRRFTGSDPGTSAAIQLKVKNFSRIPVSHRAARIYFREPEGSVVFHDYELTLDSGETEIMTLPWQQSLAVNGSYPMKFWISSAEDVHSGNDTLTQTIRVYDNPPVNLPWQYKAEGLGQTNQFPISNSEMNLEPGFGRVFSSSGRARLKTDISSPPATFGSRSIVLDKKKIDGTIGTGELIFTLNLAHYTQSSSLALDFDWLPLGTQTAGNSVWIRPNDQAEWVEIIRFQNESYVVKEVKRYRLLKLNPFLGNEPLTSSFQLKFTQTGLKSSTMPNGSGYAVDNLLLSMPEQDMAVIRLLSPADGCSGHVSPKVKIRFSNTAEQTAHHITVGYSVNGQARVVETLDSLAGYNDMNYEFSTLLGNLSPGWQRFIIWVSTAADGYPGNDTLDQQMVYIAPKINALPYYEAFESTDGNWRATGQNSSWTWGSPSKSLQVLDTAANGTHAWSTGLQGFYPNNQLSYLESPCFNFSDLQTDLQFSFNSIFSTEPDYDYAWLEMTQDGINWVSLGAMNQGTNWYNHPSHHWNGLRSNWEVSSLRVSLAALANKTQVRFRFGFSSDPSVNSEGFALDDVRMEPAFTIVNDSLFTAQRPEPSQAGWVHFGEGADMVASIENQDLGSVTLQMQRHTGITRYHLGVPYLNRNFLIRPEFQPLVPVKVRLYITDQEVKQLVDSDPYVHSFQELGIFKYDGPQMDLDAANNSDHAGYGVFIPASQVLKVPTSEGYFLEFMVTGFSEFYVASRSLSGPDDPLSVSLTSFTAVPENDQQSVLTTWVTAVEPNTERFELSYSCDGKWFEPIETVSAQGSREKGYTYRFRHIPKSCASSSYVYRLLQYERNAQAPAQYQAVCAARGEPQPDVWTNNPFQNKLTVHNVGKASTVILSDALGKVWLKTQPQTSECEFETTVLPPGTYQLAVQAEDARHTLSVLKLY